MSFISVKQIHMNCGWEIKVFPQTHLSKEKTETLVLEAFKEVKRIEDLLSHFKDSPFNNINKFAGIKPVRVCEEIWKLLDDAIEFSNDTHGSFNLAYPSKEEALRDHKLIRRDFDTREVYLPHRDMRISLGGLGKGYAVDMAYKYLLSQGVINFLVNGSGDLRCHSHERAPRPWNLAITNPFNPELTIGLLKLKNNAMATSGTYKKGQHIKTQEINRPISATIVADSTKVADMWGTYLCSLTCTEAVKKMNSSGLIGIIIDSSGNCFSSTKSLDAQKQYKDSYV
ncbi:MAG: hypothetical protein BM556_15560 [Bacteriovorax sp. MedPE-SWde]|nr:MAG: hypothetical protein BM556_15560 [Bacteriovorax sp. MedPE-SWde]